jgi:type VI secretion system protein ImpK
MRLVDCFTDVFAYVSFLVKDIKKTGPACEGVREKVEKFLLRSEDLAEDNKYSEEEFEKAKFAVCAWIDERIGLSGWAQTDKWEHNQLQRFFYNTTNAGEEFYERLQCMGPQESCVIEVFMSCFALGFKGKFYPVRETLTLEEVKMEALGKCIEEAELEADEIKLFKDVYDAKYKKQFLVPGYSLMTIVAVALPVVVGAWIYYKFGLELDSMVELFKQKIY